MATTWYQGDGFVQVDFIYITFVILNNYILHQSYPRRGFTNINNHNQRSSYYTYTLLHFDV